jgi:hypothetical protein
VLAVALGAFVPMAHAQQSEATAPAGAATEQQAPQWTGLPFTSLADYERLIPIGMSVAQLTRALGQPEEVMPGRGSDQVYHYAYQLADNSELRAVIIVRDGAVFIRRLYASSANGATTRQN